MCHLQKVPLQFIDSEILIGVEVVPDEEVDAVLVIETFPRVSSVDVTNDVVGGHGGCYSRL